MPGAISDEIEILNDAGHGGGGDVPAGGDDDSGSGRGGPRVPERAYYTAVQLALAGIIMFFMSLTSSFLVRKGLGNDWISFELPRVIWVNTAGASGQQRYFGNSSLAPSRHRRFWRRRSFSPLVGAHHCARPGDSSRAVSRLAGTRVAGSLPGHQSQQQLFLSSDGAPRFASHRRCCGIAIRRITKLAALAHNAVGRRWIGRDLLALFRRALALSLGTSIPGTVNCAPD